MGGEHRLKVAGYRRQIIQAALTSLRPVAKETDHRDATRGWPEVNSVAVGIEQRLQRDLNATRPFDDGVEATALRILHVHQSIVRAAGRRAYEGGARRSVSLAE